MGAALLPALIAPLLGSVVQSVFAPSPPKPVVVAPPPVQPGLTAGSAQQIAQTTEQKGNEFGQNLLNSILSKAKAQGTGEKELSGIKDQFNTWFGQNQDEITKSLAVQAAHSQAQADYQNAIQNNNMNTQMQALNASQPQGGGIGRMAGGLASGLMGGMFGGGQGGFSGFQAPQIYNPGQIVSGPDTTDFSA